MAVPATVDMAVGEQPAQCHDDGAARPPLRPQRAGDAGSPDVRPGCRRPPDLVLQQVAGGRFPGYHDPLRAGQVDDRGQGEPDNPSVRTRPGPPRHPALLGTQRERRRADALPEPVLGQGSALTPFSTVTPRPAASARSASDTGSASKETETPRRQVRALADLTRT
ncbi:hypothetical protein ACQP25_09365 [Microtetraspora malaysiensis]|uniref:hypothetical protein n=1 Tax=Microtetraspora malaysiensis TaxID=161358 RepID=UPI003D8DD169